MYKIDLLFLNKSIAHFNQITTLNENEQQNYYHASPCPKRENTQND